MRTEASLSDGAKSLVEDTVGDISDRSVLVQMKDRDLSIVETGDKDIVICFARRKVSSAHALDLSTV